MKIAAFWGVIFGPALEISENFENSSIPRELHQKCGNVQNVPRVPSRAHTCQHMMICSTLSKLSKFVGIYRLQTTVGLGCHWQDSTSLSVAIGKDYTSLSVAIVKDYTTRKWPGTNTKLLLGGNWQTPNDSSVQTSRVFFQWPRHLS